MPRNTGTRTKTKRAAHRTVHKIERANLKNAQAARDAINAVPDGQDVPDDTMANILGLGAASGLTPDQLDTDDSGDDSFLA